MKEVELVTSESGDWAILKVNGKVQFEGHSIPENEWLKLLKQMGAKVSSKEISDEDMEEGKH